MADDEETIPGKFYRTPSIDLEYRDGIATSVGDLSQTITTAADPDAVRMCDNCEERLGTEKWVGENGVMGLVHGLYSMWCRLCCVRKQLEHAYEVSAKIPELEKELSDLEDQSSTSTE
jgi:hypothetical protein